MIEQGRYKARAMEHQFGRSPEKGTRFVRVQFEILDEEYAGQQLHWDGWLTEGAIARTLESLQNCGWDCVSLEQMNGLGTTDVAIVVEHEENPANGKVFPRVKWVNRIGGMRIKEEHILAPNELRNLDEEFRGDIAAFRNSSGGGSNGAARPAPRPVGARPSSIPRPPQSQAQHPYDQNFAPLPDDDDIPF